MARWREQDLGDWTGRTVVVTGASSGIGLVTARALARHGASVHLASRSPRPETVPGSTAAVLDLSDLDSVRAYRPPERVDALVCNAGIMGGLYLPTPQGIEQQMATNVLGHALLLARLWPQLEAAAGRVVLVSSIAARGGRLTATSTVDDLVDPRPYEPMAVYASTKQADLLLALELERRCRAAGSAVTSVAVHPGVTSTALFSTQQVNSGHPRLAPLARALAVVAFSSARSGARATLRGLSPGTPGGSFVGPRLLGQTRGRPALLPPYASAADPAVAAHVWHLVEEVLGRRLPPL